MVWIWWLIHVVLSLLFLVGFGVLGLASYSRKSSIHSVSYFSNVGTFGATALLYLLMAIFYWIWTPDSVPANEWAFYLIAATRWLGYSVACGFLAFDTSLVLHSKLTNRSLILSILAGLLMTCTMLSGAFISGIAQPLIFLSFTNLWIVRSLVFTLGCLFYIGAIVLIAISLLKPGLNLVKLIHFIVFIVLWSIYIIAFVLGFNVLGVLSFNGETIFYFSLEFFAKYAVAVANSLLLYFVYTKGYLRIRE